MRRAHIPLVGALLVFAAAAAAQPPGPPPPGGPQGPPRAGAPPRDRAAAQTGSVDFALPLEEIAPALVTLVAGERIADGQ